MIRNEFGLASPNYGLFLSAAAGAICRLSMRRAASVLRISKRGGHTVPQHEAAWHWRWRLCAPPQHDLVHVLHALNADTTAFAGQQCTLQARVSALCAALLQK